MSNIDPLTTCLHLRSKEMYYADDDPDAEERAKEIERAYGSCDTRMFWCECTQTGRGPDCEPVGKTECSRSRRPCFVSIQSLA
ncbi:MAG: hypothetical protein O7J95_13855 [Planctomycetota bacterium]|nr:hypothetical protein [Planctomycetota bacterium]